MLTPATWSQWNDTMGLFFWPYASESATPPPTATDNPWVAGIDSQGRFFGRQLRDLPCRAGLSPNSGWINTTAAITKFDKQYTIPAAQINLVGSTLRIKAGGPFSTWAQGGNTTLMFLVYVGGVLLAQSAAITVAQNLTNSGWSLDVATATYLTGANARLHGPMAIFTAGGTAVGSTTGADTSTFSLLAAADVQIGVQWGNADVANTIRMATFIVDIATPGTIIP